MIHCFLNTMKFLTMLFNFSDIKEEETVYAEVKAVNEATELSDGKTGEL